MRIGKKTWNSTCTYTKVISLVELKTTHFGSSMKILLYNSLEF